MAVCHGAAAVAMAVRMTVAAAWHAGAKPITIGGLSRLPMDPRSPSQRLPQERRRHRFYRLLLAVTVFLMVCLALPGAWGRIIHVGYIVLTVVLVLELGQGRIMQTQTRQRPSLFHHVYRLLGMVAAVSLVLWLFIPRQFTYTGVPLFVLFCLFVGLSLSRLVQQLAQERRVGHEVVTGALAGYLLLGLSGGLVLAVLETISPGSFAVNQGHSHHALPLIESTVGGGAIPVQDRVWEMHFMHINYFAFVSLTTVGYGDILPVKPASQMASIALSILGPVYIAVVMGVLISRLTSQQEEDDLRAHQSTFSRRHGLRGED